MKKFQLKRWMVITAIISALLGTVALASCQSNVGGGSGTVTCTFDDCNTEDCNTEDCTQDCNTECDSFFSTEGCTVNTQGCVEQGCNQEGCNQTCSNSSYVCNGERINCNQYTCYDEKYTCGDVDGWFTCVGDCTNTCTSNCASNCAQQNCEGSGANCTGGSHSNPIDTPDCTGASYTYRLLESNEYLVKYPPEITNRDTRYVDKYYNDLLLTFHWTAEFHKKMKGIDVYYSFYYDGNFYGAKAVRYDTTQDLINAMLNETLVLGKVPSSYDINQFEISIDKIYAFVKD